MLYPQKSLEKAVAESPQLKRQVWDFLKGIAPKAMLNEGRVYGGGLHKLEPKELGRVPATVLAQVLTESEWQADARQLKLLDATPPYGHQVQKLPVSQSDRNKKQIREP